MNETKFSVMLTKRVDTPKNVLGSVIEVVGSNFPFYSNTDIGRKSLVINGMFRGRKGVTEFRHVHIVSPLMEGKFSINDILIKKKSQMAICVSKEDMKWFSNRPEMISEYVLVHASTQAGEFNEKTGSIVPSISKKVLVELEKSNFELNQFKNGVNALEFNNMGVTNLMYVGKVIKPKKVTDEDREEMLNEFEDIIEKALSKFQKQEKEKILIDVINFSTSNRFPINQVIVDKYNKLITGE